MLKLLSTEEEMALARLEFELRDLLEQETARHQSLADARATVRDRNTAKLGWLDNNRARIEQRWSEMVLAFESGQAENVFKVLADLEPELAKAVISIPPNGPDDSFQSQIGKIFSGDEAAALEQIFTSIHEGELTPGFEEIEAKADPMPLLETDIDKSFRRKLSGQYRADLEKDISYHRDKLMHLSSPADILENGAVSAQTGVLLERLRQFGDRARPALAARRMELMLNDPSEEGWKKVAAELERVMTKGGINALTKWLTAPTDNGSIRLTTLLATYSGNPEMQAGRLRGMLGHFPDDLARSRFLDQTASKLKGEQAEALKALRHGFTGDFLRVGKDTLFAPSQSGMVGGYEKKGEVQLCRHGFNETVKVDGATAARLTAFLKEQRGFVQARPWEVENPPALLRGYYDGKEQKIYSDYRHHPGWHARANRAEALKILAGKRDAAEGAFTELGDKSLINNAAVDYAWAGHNGTSYNIAYNMAGRTQTIYKLRDGEAVKKILDGFSATDMTSLSENRLIRSSAVFSAWISGEKPDGSCKLNFVLGAEKHDIDMSAARAREILNDWERDRGFVRLGKTQIINPAMVDHMMAKKGMGSQGKQLVITSAGEDYHAPVSGPESKVFDLLKEKAGFVALSDNVIVNPQRILGVEAEEDGFLSVRADHDAVDIPVAPGAASALFNTLAGTGRFIKLADNHLLNAGKVGWVQYHDGRLRYPPVATQADENCPAVPATPERADEVLSAIETYGKRSAVLRDLGFDPGTGNVLTGLFNRYGGAFGPASEAAAMQPPMNEPESPPVSEPEPEPEQPAKSESPKPTSGVALDDFLKFRI